MSYDMSIGDSDFNYTYNVSKMWYACYPNKGIREHYGHTGRQALPTLRKLRNYMEENQETLIEFEPENGWGSYRGALQFVNELIEASLDYPNAIWLGD